MPDRSSPTVMLSRPSSPGEGLNLRPYTQSELTGMGPSENGSSGPIGKLHNE